MYAATTKEALQDVAVIIGTILILSASVLVLFDFGSMDTFIIT